MNVSEYLSEIEKLPKLSQEEEEELLKRDLKNDEDALNRLVMSNADRVIPIATQYMEKGLPLMDLIAEGNVGLLRGIEYYNKDNDADFPDYISSRIKDTIERAIKKHEEDKLYRSALDVKQKVLEASLVLEESLQRVPSDEEIAEYLGNDFTAETVRTIKRVPAMHR